MITTKKYGWKPSRPDHRDYQFSDLLRTLSIVNTNSVDLESQCTPCYDQGDLGSCTANAGSGLAQFLMKKLNKALYMPSRLAIYYWERLLENTVKYDSGASIRDVMKVLCTTGTPHEALWTYNEKKFAVKPNLKVVADANLHKVGTYLSLVQNIDEMKQCLLMGYPFLFGFSVYESFESDEVAKTGILPMPKKTEKLVGGHAVMAVGFNDNNRQIKVRNSWGVNWGKNGYFYMPYDYILNPRLCQDFWTAHTIV